MVLLDSKPFWVSPAGFQQSDNEFKKLIANYVAMGCKVYIGTDSMLYGDSCNFATVVAFHNNDIRVAKYLYKRFKVSSPTYTDLQTKITEEVSLAIQAAQMVIGCCPDAKIEVHVDIGRNKKNKTRGLLPMVSGWVSGMGFDLRIKPESWASSAIADCHTK
jgi:uncharacterized protein